MSPTVTNDPIADQQDAIIAKKEADEAEWKKKVDDEAWDQMTTVRAVDLINNLDSEFYHQSFKNISACLIIENWEKMSIGDHKRAQIMLNEIRQYMRINSYSQAFSLMIQLSKHYCFNLARNYMRKVWRRSDW
jgi:6-phosphogluconate dehydrogenase